MSDLVQVERPELAVSATNPIAAMLQAVTQHGLTAESAAAMEKLTDLYLKMEAVNAKKSFAAAKAALQAELPAVAATRTIPGNDGVIRSTFAAYEDIKSVVRPFLTKHGFSISFTMRCETINSKDRIAAVCTLMHRDGHSESNEFSVRVSPPPKSSEAQADGATRSYARRGALCDCLDISIDHDEDARLEGDYITAAQAADLKRRVEETKSDAKKFLAYALADSFEKIRVGKLPQLDNTLSVREEAIRTGKPTPKAEPPKPLTEEEQDALEAKLFEEAEAESARIEAAKGQSTFLPNAGRPRR